VPHCSVHVPRFFQEGDKKETGQKLVVENDAWVPHSAAFAGKNLQLKGRTEDGKIDLVRTVLDPSPRPIEITCGVHPWMKGYIGVYAHPFVAISSTGGDLKAKKYEDLGNPNFGSFEIKGVPVGTKVKVKAWHERAKIFLNGAEVGPAGQEIELTPEMTLSFTAKQ